MNKIYITPDDVLSENWQKNPFPLRDRGGVYRIHDRASGELLYIGKSGNLGGRLAPSVHHIYRREMHDLFVLFVDNEQDRRRLEARFINVMRPPRNERNGIGEIDDETLAAYHTLVFG